MKGSAERKAKQLPMTNPAGSRSTDCKVQKTSGIPKDAGGGEGDDQYQKRYFMLSWP